MPGFCHLNQSELPKSANKNKNTQILQRGKNFAVFLFRESKEKKKQKKERRIFFFFRRPAFSLSCLSVSLSFPPLSQQSNRPKKAVKLQRDKSIKPSLSSS